MSQLRQENHTRILLVRKYTMQFSHYLYLELLLRSIQTPSPLRPE
jgi:hypothetical protein